jgi:hypothetical protein
LPAGRPGRQKRAALIEAKSSLEVSNTKLYGVVMNQIKNGSANNYEYQYHDSLQEASGNGQSYDRQGDLHQALHPLCLLTK